MITRTATGTLTANPPALEEELTVTRPSLPPFEEYEALLANNGFMIRNCEVMTVDMPLGGFEDISEYSLWIEGVLPGVPLEAGRDALIEGARQAFAELGLKTSPRNWLLVVASRA